MYHRVLSGIAFAALLVGQPILAADAPVASLEPLYVLSGEWRGTDGEGKSYRAVYQLTSWDQPHRDSDSIRQSGHDDHVLYRRRTPDADPLLFDE